MIRLHKYIAQSGLCSRRKAEALIVAGRVQVNGKTVTKLGTKIDPEKDIVKVDGKVIKSNDEFIYIAYHKPRGILTTLNDPFGRPTILDHLRKTTGTYSFPRVHHVGRLDKDSEGLLILTNDGELTHRLLHPSKKVEKEYRVTVQGIPPKEAIRRLEKGVIIQGKKTMPCSIKKIKQVDGDSIFIVKLKEGRKRQIRYMFKIVGHPVKRLIRTRIGPVLLGKLAPGQFRYLSPKEIQALKN